MKLVSPSTAAPAFAFLLSLFPRLSSPLRFSSSFAMAASNSNAAEPSSSSNHNKPYQPVHIYPYSSSIEEIKAKGNYSTIKRFHVIRHAEGTHNVNKEYKDIVNLDARLTPKGKEQCHSLAQQLQQAPKGSTHHQLLHNTQLVVTSPLTRCMETALLSFPTLTQQDNNKIAFVAFESIRETVNYACDRRRTISELEQHWKEKICFQQLEHDHDELWDHYERRLGEDWDQHRESAELHRVADRARDFWTWAQVRPEPEMVVCTHSAFLRAFKNWGQAGGVPLLMPQTLDQRPLGAEEFPVVQYCCDDPHFEAWMRSDYANCELRSFIGAFPA